MRARTEGLRRDGYRICVVPTMGALHEGHLSLLRKGRSLCDVLIVTIFVNPTQFGPGEDLSRYPRQEARDIELARNEGANLAYCPTVEAMYPPGYQTFVEVREVSRGMCGASRPGHFAGVASVVSKLFHATHPHVAVFGKKDYQQLAVIRRLNTDLDFGIEIVGGEIVRDQDGLALSSRNQYLNPEERKQASCLYRGLVAAKDHFDAGERAPDVLKIAVRSAVAQCPLVILEYIELRDAEDLTPVSSACQRPLVLALAARVGTTRLIDNIVLGG